MKFVLQESGDELVYDNMIWNSGGCPGPTTETVVCESKSRKRKENK